MRKACFLYYFRTSCITSELLVLLQNCFKKADIQFKHNNVLRNGDGGY